MIDLLGVPVPSAALFLLSGLLLGHLLWYRDRAGKAAENADLENRYVKARGSVKQRKTQLRELRKQNDTLTEEFANLQQAHTTLRSKNKRLEQISELSKEELNQFRQSLNESEVQLASEEKHRETVLSQLQELLATKSALEAENKSHQEGIEQLDQQFRQSVTELESAQCELDTLRSSLRGHESDLDDKQRCLDELERRVGTQEQSLEETSNTLQQTQQDLVARCSDLDVLRSERDTIDQELHGSKQSLAHLESALSSAATIQSERDEFATDLETAANSLAEQRHALELCESELSLNKDHINQLAQRLVDATDQIAEEHDNRTQLEQFNNACQSQLLELEEELRRRSDECAQLNLALNLAHEAASQTQQQIPTLLNELDQSHTTQEQLQILLEQKTQQIDEWQAQIQSERLEQLSIVENQLSTAEQTIQEYHQRGAALESLFIQQADQIAVLSQQSDRVPELELELKREQGSLREALKQIEDRQDTIATTEQACDETQHELADTVAEVHALENRLESRTADLLSLVADNDLLTATNRKTAAQVAILELQLGDSESRQQQLDAATTELFEIGKERDLLIQTRDSLEASVTRLSHQITSHLTDAKQMNERLTQTTLDHHKLESDLEAEIKAGNNALEELKVAKAAQGEQEQLKIQIAELTSHLVCGRDELEDSLDTNAKAQDRIRDMENQLHEHVIKIRELRRERNSTSGTAIAKEATKPATVSDQRAA